MSWVAVCGAAPGLALGELNLGCAQGRGGRKAGAGGAFPGQVGEDSRQEPES